MCGASAFDPLIPRVRRCKEAGTCHALQMHVLCSSYIPKNLGRWGACGGHQGMLLGKGSWEPNLTTAPSERENRWSEDRIDLPPSLLESLAVGPDYGEVWGRAGPGRGPTDGSVGSQQAALQASVGGFSAWGLSTGCDEGTRAAAGRACSHAGQVGEGRASCEYLCLQVAELAAANTEMF